MGLRPVKLVVYMSEHAACECVLVGGGGGGGAGGGVLHMKSELFPHHSPGAWPLAPPQLLGSIKGKVCVLFLAP